MSLIAKQCSCCGLERPLEAFQIRRASADGRTAACKECQKARDRARYPKERAARLKGMRQYAATDNGRKKTLSAKRAYAARHPGRRAANIALCNALRDGRVTRDPCHCCGAAEVEGHHADYSRPLDVTWLCVEHHNQLHTEHAARMREIAQKEHQ